MKKIPLTQGKFALVDDEDYERLTQWKWHLVSKRYAGRRRRQIDGRGPQCIYMHREILGLKDTVEQTDHVNGNKLDNRRENLRAAADVQNKVNQFKITRTIHASQKPSRFKGVYWNNQDGRWGAGISVGYQRRNLGLFVSEEDAARAYDAAARKIRGEFARLNFPLPGERSALRRS